MYSTYDSYQIYLVYISIIHKSTLFDVLFLQEMHLDFFCSEIIHPKRFLRSLMKNGQSLLKTSRWLLLKPFGHGGVGGWEST